MSIPDQRSTERPAGNAAGRRSLGLGIFAVVGQFVPVIGDFLAGPLGAVAVLLGIVGLRRVERGTATNFGQSLAGLALGAFAVLMILFFLAVIR